MKTFFDSSAFAKRYVQEQGSESVYKICLGTTQLALSIICIPEIISALNRKLREKNITKQNYSIAKGRILEEIEDAIIVNITPQVIHTSLLLLESNILRAMDSLHIACAYEWGAELFVSADKNQTKAAKKAGLAVRLV